MNKVFFVRYKHDLDFVKILHEDKECIGELIKTDERGWIFKPRRATWYEPDVISAILRKIKALGKE